MASRAKTLFLLLGTTFWPSGKPEPVIVTMRLVEGAGQRPDDVASTGVLSSPEWWSKTTVPRDNGAESARAAVPDAVTAMTATMAAERARNRRLLNFILEPFDG